MASVQKSENDYHINVSSIHFPIELVAVNGAACQTQKSLIDVIINFIDTNNMHISRSFNKFSLLLLKLRLCKIVPAYEFSQLAVKTATKMEKYNLGGLEIWARALIVPRPHIIMSIKHSSDLRDLFSISLCSSNKTRLAWI